jgi:hypothetical protein
MSTKVACVDGPIVNRINVPNVNNIFMIELNCEKKRVNFEINFQ